MQAKYLIFLRLSVDHRRSFLYLSVTNQWRDLEMLSDREEIVHALDHALTATAALRRANEGKETAIVLKRIEDAMDAAWSELTRPQQ
jgi:hypothetical protein